MKVGDKIICIDDKQWNDITVGKTYKVLDVRKYNWSVTEEEVCIINDLNVPCVYEPERFLPDCRVIRAMYGISDEDSKDGLEDE